MKYKILQIINTYYAPWSAYLYVTSLYVSDRNVYITGYYKANGGSKAYLFKNGVKTDLSSTSNYVEANSVFVY